MPGIEYRWGPEVLDDEAVIRLLSGTGWAAQRPAEVTRRALRTGLCISAWDGTAMIGFARVVTDFACYAYLADVVVGTTMTRKLIDHDALASCRIVLHSSHAQPLYRRLGFAPSADAMVRQRRRHWGP